MSGGTYAQRISRPPPYESRRKYIDVRGDQGSRFCSVLKKFALRPWVTVVLGSGWMSSEGRREALRIMLSRIDGTLADPGLLALLDDLPDGSSAVNTVRWFAADLVADRLGVEVVDVPPLDEAALRNPPSSPDPVDVWIGKVLTAAMLVTKTYFSLRAVERATAMHRFGHEEEAILTRTTTSLWVTEGLAGRAKAVVKALLDGLDAAEPAAEQFAARVLGPLEADQGEAVEGLLKSFQRVARNIDTGLHAADDRVCVAESDVRALTELSWFCISTLAEGTYPGWLDLLLELSQYSHGSVGRPSFDNMTVAGRSIRSRYMRLTMSSWEKPDVLDDASRAVHESVARFLEAENKTREDIRQGSGARMGPQKRPPLAVAHVTSFDLELEMALIRQQVPFHVLFPVYVMDGFSDLLHPRWCLLDVPDRRQLDDVLHPEPTRVTMLNGHSNEIDELGTPVVVRLTGCPLIHLPPLVSADRSAGSDGLTQLGRSILGAGVPGQRGDPEHGDVGDRAVRTEYEGAMQRAQPDETLVGLEELMEQHITVEHAVIVSEHSAMLQNAMDLQPWTPGESLGRRLPLETVTDDRGWRRYWMLLGVQIADHAVRQRVSHVASWYPASDPRRLRGDVGDRRGSGQRHSGEAANATSYAEGVAAYRTAGDGDVVAARPVGLLVSRTVGQLEQDLMFWNRFDIVANEETGDFAKDLDHLIEHLQNMSKGGAMGPC